MADGVRLALAGDVMTGRGIDQVLGSPGDPRLHERYVTDARQYVGLAERVSGPIPRRVPPTHVWGDLLGMLDDARPDAWVANLETAVTGRGSPWPGKGIHYRMHPDNVDCLVAAGLDAVTLANNHVLDWSWPGMDETLEVLAAAGIATCGVGHDLVGAWRPAILAPRPGRRVVVFGLAMASSGVPDGWRAGTDQPGLVVVDPDDDAVAEVAARVHAVAEPRDVVVASLHWGPNWGHVVAPARRRFAQGLVERAGVHVVHGHSSHHVQAIEVYRGQPILYGCGDLVTDYEGIAGHEEYRGDLGAVHLLDLDEAGRLRRLELLPTRMRGFRLQAATAQERAWLAATLSREGARFGTEVVDHDHRLLLRW